MPVQPGPLSCVLYVASHFRSRADDLLPSQVMEGLSHIFCMWATKIDQSLQVVSTVSHIKICIFKVVVGIMRHLSIPVHYNADIL